MKKSNLLKDSEYDLRQIVIVLKGNKVKMCGKISSGILLGLIIIVGIAAYLAWSYAFLAHRAQAINMAWNQVQIRNKQQMIFIDDLVNAIESSNSDQLSLDDIIDAQTTCAMLNLTDDLIDNKHDFNEYVQRYDNLGIELEELLSNINDDPNLKLKYRDLTTQLLKNKTEVINAWQNYDNLVITYNKKLGVFPNNIVAPIFNFPLKNRYHLQ